jgi:hypothetical protein
MYPLQASASAVALLSQTPFVPNSLGQLHTPGQLYDPRMPELVALLDPDACFPAAAFCSTSLSSAAAGESVLQDGSDNCSDGFSSLAALQQLGMRSSADLGTLVRAARYVEKTAREGDEDMAVARGKVGCHRSWWLCIVMLAIVHWLLLIC